MQMHLPTVEELEASEKNFPIAYLPRTAISHVEREEIKKYILDNAKEDEDVLPVAITHFIRVAVRYYIDNQEQVEEWLRSHDDDANT